MKKFDWLMSKSKKDKINKILPRDYCIEKNFDEESITTQFQIFPEKFMNITNNPLKQTNNN